MQPTEIGIYHARENSRRLDVDVPAEPAVRLILLGVLIAAPLVVLALANAGGLAATWNYLHWTLSSAFAFAATILGARSATGRARSIRLAGAWIFGVSLVTNVTWAILGVLGVQTIPSIAELILATAFVPASFMLVKAVEGRLSKAEEVAVYFDSALVIILIGTLLIVGHGAAALALPTLAGVVALAYPAAFFGFSAAAVVAFASIRLPIEPRGGFAMASGMAIVGLAYLGWVVPAATGTVGSDLPSVLFTVGTLVAGFGVATWRDEMVDSPRYFKMSGWSARVIGPTAASLTFLMLIVPLSSPIEGIIRVAAFVTGTIFIIRQGLLLRERTNMLAQVRRLHVENDRLVDELRQELVERAHVQDQLINATRLAAVGELAAGVAHEVNNPLTSVLGFAEILLDDLDLDDPRRQDVQTILDGALRARTIVRALGDFARPSELALVPTDLPNLISRMVDLVRFPLTRAGVVISESYAPLPLIELDAQAIQQVMLNVLTNAMQAMPDGGTLRIESSIRGSDAVVTISDDGLGMNDVVAGQAFVPFFSARGENESRGLGLSVSLGLVASHLGTIQLQSAEGAGTTVEIALPVQR